MAEGKPEAPLMLGVSGLRGIVGESLTPEVAMRFAGAFGAWIRQRSGLDHPPVAVGRDGRINGAELMEIVVKALVDAGCRVRDEGVAMTPSMSHSVDHFGGGAAIVITASHNPAEWNGLKLLADETVTGREPVDPGYTDTCALPLLDANEVINTFHSLSEPVAFHGGSYTKAGTPESAHAADVTELIRRELKDTARLVRLVSVVDSVNCAGSLGCKSLFDRLGMEYHQLHGDNSGVFPHAPEPTAENLSGEGGLCDAVPGLKADVGFAQDPDGDRLAIVDETGRYIGEEYTLALCAVSILEAHKSRGREHAGKGTEEIVLCANLSTSRMIDDIAARYGALVVRTAVGEANVVEAMKRLKREGKTVLLGGEGNGGVIWPEVTYVRDSLGSMALVVSLMARTGKTVSELVADIPSYAIVKRKQPLANKADSQPAIDRIAKHYQSERVDTQDGVRVDFDAKKAWVHVRASNTEPILRLIAEAEDEATANAILDEVAKLVGS